VAVHRLRDHRADPPRRSGTRCCPCRRPASAEPAGNVPGRNGLRRRQPVKACRAREIAGLRPWLRVPIRLPSVRIGGRVRAPSPNVLHVLRSWAARPRGRWLMYGVAAVALLAIVWRCSCRPTYTAPLVSDPVSPAGGDPMTICLYGGTAYSSLMSLIFATQLTAIDHGPCGLRDQRVPLPRCEHAAARLSDRYSSCPSRRRAGRWQHPRLPARTTPRHLACPGTSWAASSACTP
jgi:hypothetical protein